VLQDAQDRHTVTLGRRKITVLLKRN
jgi:hypothetical protein